jgi:hypothetical protein
MSAYITNEESTIFEIRLLCRNVSDEGKNGFYNTDDTWLRFKDASEPFGKGGVAPVDKLLRQGHVVGEHDELLDEVLTHRNLAIGR